jgi:hypothetical protein
LSDPMGHLVDQVAEMILEYRPTGRRRLTTSEPSARELAEQIVDFVWTYDAAALDQTQPDRGD